MPEKPRIDPHAPLVWTNALMFAMTFAAAAILVPWYGLTHGFSTADWSVFAFFLIANGMAVTAGVPPEDPASLSPEEQARRRALLYNQRARPAPSEAAGT